MIQLPKDAILDIRALSKIFDKTQNSYKLLLFGFLLREIPKRAQNQLFFNRVELDKGMLKIAEFPVLKCRLSLGQRDQTAAALQRGEDTRLGQIDLLRWVPYRLIRPFFSDSLSTQAEQVINSEVAVKSEQAYESQSPALYKIVFSNREMAGIEIHPFWQAYLVQHRSIVEAWWQWHWASYLQRRNPGALNVMQKLERPARQHQELDRVRKLWREIAQTGGRDIRCTFTRNPIQPSEIVVDHFLPWSYVGHNQKWNLCPTTQAINSRKSDLLPSDTYLKSLVDIQMLTLQWVRNTKPERDWSIFIEEYETALQLKDDELLIYPRVDEAIRSALQPHFQLAKNLGFSSEWRC